MNLRLVAQALAGIFVIAACASGQDGATSEAGAAVRRLPEPTQPLYSPVGRGALLYALPTAVSGLTLIESTPDVIAADEGELAADPLIHRALVQQGLGPSVIRVAQRGTDLETVPDVSITAIQFKGLPAEDFSTFVPSVYLLATSVDGDQHNLTGAKPPRKQATIEGRVVQLADWGAFDVAWYPHGDVVFVVLAKNPQLLASALRALPPFPGTTVPGA